MNHTSATCYNSSTSWILRKRNKSKSCETHWILLFLHHSCPQNQVNALQKELPAFSLVLGFFGGQDLQEGLLFRFNSPSRSCKDTSDSRGSKTYLMCCKTCRWHILDECLCFYRIIPTQLTCFPERSSLPSSALELHSSLLQKGWK